MVEREEKADGDYLNKLLFKFLANFLTLRSSMMISNTYKFFAFCCQWLMQSSMWRSGRCQAFEISGARAPVAPDCSSVRTLRRQNCNAKASYLTNPCSLLFASFLHVVIFELNRTAVQSAPCLDAFFVISAA